MLSVRRTVCCTVLGTFALLMLPAPVPVAAGSQRGGQAPATGEPRVNALVVSGGCCHDWQTQGQILMQSIAKVVPVDWTVAYQGDRGTRSRFPVYNRADWAKGFDIVVHNECSADVTDPEFLRAITAGHKTGIPAVVIHCSMHSYRAATVDDWRELLGVTSRRHTAAHQISVKWARDNPVAQGLPDGWVTPVDELYVIDKFWPNSKVVGSATSPEDQKEYPLAWTGEYHGARVFGTTLGHGNDTWKDPVFQQMLARGFQWALKKDAK